MQPENTKYNFDRKRLEAEFSNMADSMPISDQRLFDNVEAFGIVKEQGIRVYELYKQAMDTTVDWVKEETERWYDAWCLGLKTTIEMVDGLNTLIIQGHSNPNPGVDPPSNSGEFSLIHSIDQCAFTVRKVNGELCCGTYGQLGEENTAKFINFVTGETKVYDSETVYDICQHKGNWFTSHEAGSDGHGKIRIAGTDTVVWTAPYNIILGLTSEKDEYLYVSCLDYEGRKPPKIFRSFDGLNGWEEYCSFQIGINPTSHCIYNGNIWTAASNTGVVWGGNAYPHVICNREIVFREENLKGFGFYGRPCSFNGSLYLPLCGSYSGVYHYENRKIVLRVDDCEACTWIGTDGSKLYALFSNGFRGNLGGNSKCYTSVDGESWGEPETFDMKIAFAGSFEDDGFYVAGGDNYGQVNRSGKVYRKL